jgi:hypothetical protein
MVQLLPEAAKPFQFKAGRSDKHGGRKPADESRAWEICARLAVWKQTPKQQRISLRALASQLGTSHQLLSFHLKRLDKWLERVYGIKAKEIRDRAKAENRSLTPSEQAQAHTLERAALCSMLARVLDETFKRWETEFANAHKLTGPQLKFLNHLARRGVPFAQPSKPGKSSRSLAGAAAMAL